MRQSNPSKCNCFVFFFFTRVHAHWQYDSTGSDGDKVPLRSCSFQFYLPHACIFFIPLSLSLSLSLSLGLGSITIALFIFFSQPWRQQHLRRRCHILGRCPAHQHHAHNFEVRESGKGKNWGEIKISREGGCLLAVTRTFKFSLRYDSLCFFFLSFLRDSLERNRISTVGIKALAGALCTSTTLTTLA